MDTTVTDAFDGDDFETTEEKEAGTPVLAVIWSAEEPDRVGEVLCFQNGQSATFGRGSATDGATRAALTRQRPGRSEPRAAITSSKISRDQLRFELDGGRLSVENLGRLPLAVNGVAVSRAILAEGDVLEIGHQMSMLCVRRPNPMRAWAKDVRFPMPLFGEADNFGIVGESPVAWALREQLAFMAGRRTHLLVLGASGAGKELVAQAIHGLSARARRTMVSRSAATLPDSLIDAELFGNVKDYPNPGMRDRPGLIGEANGTTLFLDEIGELSTDLQSHLLRVLDRGEYQRLGEESARHSDFRLIAATNRPDAALKHDLFARLRVRIRIPGLNERREDIPLIVRHFLRSLAASDTAIASRYFDEDTNGFEPRVAPMLMRALVQHPYSTHVRELESRMWEAISVSRGTFLECPSTWALESRPPNTADPKDLSREVIEEALARHHGVQNKVWPELGLRNRYALARLMRKYGLGGAEGDVEDSEGE